MLGAILCFSPQKLTFARMRGIKPTTLALPVGEGGVLLYTLPYTVEAFAALEQKQKERLLLRYARHMEKRGVACVYPVQGLRKQVRGNFYIPDGRRIFCALAGQIIERHIKTFSLTPDTLRVCVYENPFTEAGAAAAEFMAMHTKQLCLVSPEEAGAKRMAARLFDGYGLAADVTENEKVLNKADIVLLVSPPKGEVLSNGLVLDFSGQYSHRARRDLYFEPAFGFAPFLMHFDRPDCRSAEFMLLCCGEDASSDVRAALEGIGWYEKT